MKKNCLILVIVQLCVFLAAQTINDTVYKAQISSKIAEQELEGALSLWFTDADTGKPVTGALVAINNVGSTKTDKDGLAFFPVVDDGEYQFIFQKDGYMMVKDQFEVFSGNIFFNKYSVPKKIQVRHIKIVLDWGENPSDLDVHFVKTGQYHISYRDMKKNQDGTVWLDRDDMSGYGPEAITVTEFDNMGTYRFFVHNYSQQSNRSDTGLSPSNAIVRVYLDNQLKHTFRVPQDMAGIFWNVFDIKNSVIIPVNTITQQERK